ncbi:hypothetical protein GOEFS_018_00740 [Gordonia effusa NBRC 100432]|uniref:DUF2946 domain-containing protein n=2 Tax=Gordonia effusa TaxID=263908 RepID=H0QW41_9ACTN|nr:hypothetical protein GOEFS_018_00740 [Gordonia effusa NBRC 100432]
MPRLLLLLATAGAVFLMHSAFGSHCAGAMPMHHAESAMPDVVTMDVHHGASMTSVADARTVEKASAPSDCVMPGSCTFVLPGATAIIVLAILVLTVFGPRDLFIRLVIPRRVVLGRPPPWAIATHLSLGVLLR